jgi:RHS repeat-associated protein
MAMTAAEAFTASIYFGARYFPGAQGRFTSPDPLMASANVGDPRSWNRYTYDRNNPLKFVDPTGLAEIRGADCETDNQCFNVKLNVIYDKSANGGEGLTGKQKTRFTNSILKQAKSEYGEARIHFDVFYSAGGAIDGKVEGAVKGALNVVVSDSSLTSAAGSSGEKNGFEITAINMYRADSGTLAHEFAHVFMGDTNGIMNSVADAEPIIFGTAANVYTDIRNDYERFRLGAIGPYFGTRFDPPPGAPLPITTPLNQGAKRFQAPMTQQAIRPTQ